MTPTIAEMVARYDLADGEFITLRLRDGKVHITAANMYVETGDEVMAIIADFKSRVGHKQEKPKPQPRKAAAPKPRRSRCMFNDEQQAEIIQRYKAGEGPTAISASLGCSKSAIVHLLSRAGVTEGRTGQHLKKKPEPQPEAEDKKEPV